MISSYLQLDKAKHGDMIKALDDDYSRLSRLIYEMEVERDAIEFTLKNSYLKDPLKPTLQRLRQCCVLL